MSRARSIPLAADEGGRVRVLGGPPDSRALRSGVVTLAPGEAVGRHNTRDGEELIFVLEGRGELRVDGMALALAPDAAGYCPPLTDHDVVNTGDAPLRYLYVVTGTRP